MPIKSKHKLLLFKNETVYGTDSVPTPADNAVLASNFEFSPMEGTDIQREHELPWLGNAGSIPAELHARIQFDVELVGSGTAGTPPAIGPLLRGFGTDETIVPDTSVMYNPISEDPESASAYMMFGPMLFRLLGSRLTGTLMVSASAIPKVRCTMLGLFSPPVDQTFPTTADFSAFRKPRVASSLNSNRVEIDGTPFVTRSLELDFGVQIEPRFMIGSESIELVDRAEKLSMQFEMTPLTTFDPFAAARNEATLEIDFAHDLRPGYRVDLNVPALQLERPGAPTEEQKIFEMQLTGNPLPVTGNDQWTLTFT